jgi:alcohol dehydrogenase
MRALRFDGGEPAVVADHVLPARARGEARLALRLGGVCNTDLEIARGYMAFRGVLGHEFVATVLEADDPEWVGRRVVGEINCGCAACDVCATHGARHCPVRTVLGILGRDGAFAERFDLPLRNLHLVPAAVSDEAAVFVEPLAAACRILEQVGVAATSRVAVLGDGKLGALCAAVLATVAGRVTLIGRHPGRLPLPQNVVECAAAAAPARAFDLVIEATGSPQGLAQALALAAPLATVVLKTTCQAKHAVHLAPLVIDEITVVGSRCGPFDRALALLADGRIDPRPWIAARYPLAEGGAALAAAARPGALKVLIAGAAGS